MEQNLAILILGALLHDIGIFAQQAGAPKSEWREYTDGSDTGNAPTQAYLLHGHYFIKNTLPLPDELNSEQHRQFLAQLLVSRPGTADKGLTEQTLHRASILADGTTEALNIDTNNDKSRRLASVFEKISFGRTPASYKTCVAKYYPLSPLETDSFPGTLEEATTTDYPQLFEKFSKSLEGIPLDMGVQHYISSLISLLENYTWCIPRFSHKDFADISLFDHARTSAIIAQCLWFYHSEKGNMPGQQKDTPEKKFILLGGDLSGIQSYIFELDKSHATGVAKLFRARSCHLQALTKSVIVDLLERLDLNSVAQLMDAGGRFILLLPNTQKVLDALPRFDFELQQWFFENFSGALCLNLSYTTKLSEEDLLQGRFRKIFDAFSHQLEAAKLKNFSKLMEVGISPVIDLDFSKYVDGACRICRIMPAEQNETTTTGKSSDRLTMICHHCRNQIEIIGKRLPATRFMIIDRRNDSEAIELFNGLYLHLRKEIDRDRDKTAAEIINIRDRRCFAHQAIAAHLPMITQSDIERWQEEGKLDTTKDGGQTYQGEEVGVDMPKTFNILAGEARQRQKNENGDISLVGKSFLGALKADVDNLGLIFSIGLGDALTFTRFACLSRMLNHFFSDYLVKRIESEFKDMYIIFAGGDDLFLLGPWTQLIHFTREVGRAFQRYVADNPEVTLSAGIAIAKSRLPVPGIAALAKTHLEESKDKSVSGVMLKNAVTAFDTTVSWADFDKLIEKGDWLHDLISKQHVPTALANRLLNYGQQHQEFIQGDIKKGIYISHMQYDFARNVTEKRIHDPTERAQVLGIQNDEFLLQHIRLPVSWALYRLRKD
jgi:CRISPR-associated protein Csm1